MTASFFAFRGGVPLVFLYFLSATPSDGRVLQVGPGKTYSAPRLAAGAVSDGDTVEIAAGVYPGETASWTADNLLLRGAAAYARLEAPVNISNGKAIWVIQGKNTTVENIEFTGARVPDRNGAGIRQEGDNLTVRRCYFHDNENGILGGGGGSSVVLVEYSEFASNGNGDGYSHNMYISNVAAFTLRFSSSRLAKIGHLVKSRAQVNHILYNRIMDESEGASSYQVDMPNGGVAYILGNLIQQGPKNDNPIFISFGAEGSSNPGKQLYVMSNTLVNDGGTGTFIDPAGGTAVKAWNNLIVGPGRFLNGAGDTAANLVSSNPGLVDRAGYGYRLTAASPAIDKGRDPGMANGISLAPAFEYAPEGVAKARPQSGLLDIGAYEFQPGASSRGKTKGVKGKIKGGAFLQGSNPDAPPRMADAQGRILETRGTGAYWDWETHLQ